MSKETREMSINELDHKIELARKRVAAANLAREMAAAAWAEASIETWVARKEAWIAAARADEEALAEFGKLMKAKK